MEKDQMKTSDAIALRVKEEVDTVFGVTGGCIINVVDSLHKNGVRIIGMHHEQSAAIAADAYARFKGFGVCFATSGPGVTNLLTGVCCSYYDSIPVLAIGGQVPSKYLDGVDRQMGFQEVDGVSLFKPFTKASRRFRDMNDLEVCISKAKGGRRGPAFIEIPDDVQRFERATPEYVPIFEEKEDTTVFNMGFGSHKHPLLIVGSGARDAKIDIKMPFLYTWGMKDRYQNHPFCKGDFGITGSPYGNRLIKEADIIIMVGTRMDSHQVPDWNKFAPQAYKVAIGLEFPHPVNRIVEANLDESSYVFEAPDWCNAPCDPFPGIGAYGFIDNLCYESTPDDIIIPDMGQIGCIALQRWKIKEGQRLFNGMNHSPMGYALPGAIGAAVATGRRVIVIVGDGSLMMNLQDLQTISDLKLPINIFVVNNGGYGMIRQTRDDWKQYLDQGVACNFKTPSAMKLAETFDLDYSPRLSHVPSIYEIKLDDTRIIPKWKYGEVL